MVRARARARDIIDCSLRPHTQHQSIQDRQRHSADCGAAHTSHINTRVRSNAHSLFTRTRTTRTDAAESFDVSHSAQPRDSLQRHALPRDLSSAPRPRSHSNGRHVRLPPVKATRVTPASLHTHTRRVRTPTCWRPPPAHVPHPAPCIGRLQHQHTCALGARRLDLSPAGAVPVVSADAESAPHRARHELARSAVGLCGVRHLDIGGLRRSAAGALGWLTPAQPEGRPWEEVGGGGGGGGEEGGGWGEEVVARLGVRGRASDGEYTL